jgi:adenylate cyclase
MGSEQIQLGILFVDVSDSSRLYRLVGVKAASDTIKALLGSLSAVVRAEGGAVLDQIGDELLCRFPTADATARAAVELQRTTVRFSELRSANEAVAVRIGFHFGHVLLTGGRLFGDALYCAKRLVDFAKAMQIVLTATTRDRLTDPEAGPFRHLETRTLKGQKEPVELLELLWGDIGLTSVLKDPERSSREPPRRFELLAGDRSWTVPSNDQLSVGRVPPCEVVVTSSLVSRLHARVREENRVFLLEDLSTNGTFVLGDGDCQPRFLRRGEMRLPDAGLIGLGKKPENGKTHTLRFHSIKEKEQK